MHRTLFLVMAIVLIGSLTACIKANQACSAQSENPKMPTRVIENGTKINMRFDDVIIPGILNNSTAAQHLISMLPYTVRVNRYPNDFCGVMNPLKFNEEDVHSNWLNGDIDFATDENHFTIMFGGEENAEQYGYHLVNIGVIDCELSKVSNLQGNYEILIELVK